MGVPIIKPQWVPENRFLPVRQTIPGGTDAISWCFDGDDSANVSYEYEGVLKVIRRSRATLIFTISKCAYGKASVGLGGSLLLLGRSSPQIQTPSSVIYLWESCIMYECVI